MFAESKSFFNKFNIDVSSLLMSSLRHLSKIFRKSCDIVSNPSFCTFTWHEAVYSEYINKIFFVKHRIDTPGNNEVKYFDPTPPIHCSYEQFVACQAFSFKSCCRCIFHNHDMQIFLFYVTKLSIMDKLIQWVRHVYDFMVASFTPFSPWISEFTHPWKIK